MSTWEVIFALSLVPVTAVTLLIVRESLKVLFTSRDDEDREK